LQGSPVAYGQQANVAHVVEVNNWVARGANAESWPTELLEQQHGSEWLDGRTAGTAGEVNPGMETVGTVYGAEDDRR
jgi:hypothetical protein